MLLDWADIFRVYALGFVQITCISFFLGTLFFRVNSDLQAWATFYTIISIGFSILGGIVFIITLVFGLNAIILSPIWEITTILLLLIILACSPKINFVLLKNNLQSQISFWLFLGLAGLRFLPLKSFIFPSYSDSPIHYQIIEQLIYKTPNYLGQFSIENIFEKYYHFGFHAITAWISILGNMEIAQSMLLIGQFALIIAPVSVATLTYIISKNNVGTFISGFIAVFGWTMPAFAVNWGKYPAILAISITPAIIGVMIILFKTNGQRISAYVWVVFLAISLISAHTRSIILLTLALASILSLRLIKLPQKISYFSAIRISILSVISILPLRDYFFTFYNRYLVLALIIFLLPFAFQKYLKQTTGIYFFLIGIWIVVFLQKLLKTPFPELLDVQFISIMLFIPLSLLGGLGIAGFAEQFSSPLQYKTAVLGFAVAILLYSPWQSSLRPDSCCEYFLQGDKTAFQWIEKTTSKESLFLISTITGNGRQFGTDAGVWITALTKRNTNKINFMANWDQIDAYPQQCNPNKNNVYIYSGGKLQSFSNAMLMSKNWVDLVYTAKDVNIYKMKKCLDQ